MATQVGSRHHRCSHVHQLCEEEAVAVKDHSKSPQLWSPFPQLCSSHPWSWKHHPNAPHLQLWSPFPQPCSSHPWTQQSHHHRSLWYPLPRSPSWLVPGIYSQALRGLSHHHPEPPPGCQHPCSPWPWPVPAFVREGLAKDHPNAEREHRRTPKPPEPWAKQSMGRQWNRKGNVGEKQNQLYTQIHGKC